MGILDLLEEPPWSLVDPWVAPGPRGAVGGPVTRPDRSRGHPDLPANSSRPIPRNLDSSSNPCKIKDF